MVTLTIDNQTVRVAEGTTILEAAKSAGIIIPHLCYLKELNEIAACRVCSVEVEGETAMVTACCCRGHGRPYQFAAGPGNTPHQCGAHLKPA